MGSTLPTQTGDQREGDVDVILEIWGIEPTFSTQSGARKMVVLSLFDGDCCYTKWEIAKMRDRPK